MDFGDSELNRSRASGCSPVYRPPISSSLTRATAIAVAFLTLATTQGCTGADLHAEYMMLCKRAGTVIERRIPAVRSFLDSTGNGCSSGCWLHVLSKSVEFVEVEFSTARYRELVKRNDRYAVGNYVPPSEGIFEVTRSPSEDCSILDEFREGKVSPSKRPYCLKFRRLHGAVQSTYSYSERRFRKERAGSSISGTQIEVRDRKDGEIVARSEFYYFYGSFSSVLPFLPEQSSCGTTPPFFTINDAFVK
jgi:hypothetical protein